MRPSLALRLSRVQLTLFTRANCGLCDVAKTRLIEFNKTQSEPPQYKEIDIMAPGEGEWKDVYDYDVPVLHIDSLPENDRQVEPSLKAAKKLMHRFTVDDIERAAREVEKGSP